MAKSTVRSARFAWQARLMSAINVPMRLILRLPVATPLSGRLMLLHLTGRKSGRAYQQPVSYVPDGDTLLTPGGGRWKLNLRQAECIHIHLRGHDVLARPELIKDVDEVDQLLHRMMALNPRITSFAPVAGPDGQIDRARVEVAVKYGFSIVRWHFDCPPVASSTTTLAR
jgi:deazaflavin-dependent oxidoreductase (nitroreductase family)